MPDLEVSHRARTLLKEGLAHFALALPEEAVRRLLHFLALLERWNRVYNLSAVSDPERAVTYHLLDSLSILPHLHGRRLLDLGSGAGLPGVPVAVAQPDRHCTLIDSRHKPASFLRHAQALLPLPNVTVQQERVQNYQAAPFDSLLVRGYGPLRRILADSAHLISPATRVLAMKGKYPEAELRELGEEYRLSGAFPLRVPALPASRHLVVLRRCVAKVAQTDGAAPAAAHSPPL